MAEEKKNSGKKRLIVGISGASGAILGIQLLKLLGQYPDWETHLIMTEGAKLTIRSETEYTVEQVAALADRTYEPQQIGASIASGTFRTEGMVILPCSMKTIAGIASGYCDNLLLRAADVTLKEKRKLVLAARECPLSAIHLRNMLTLTEAGAYIMPPVLSYYQHPQSIEDMNLHFLGKLLDKFDLEPAGYRRWGEGCSDYSNESNE